MTVFEETGISRERMRAAKAARQVLLDMGCTLHSRPMDKAAPYITPGSAAGWGSPRPYGPMRFTWGRVVAIHRVGGYVIVESLRYKEGPYDPFALKDRPVDDDNSGFHIFVDGYDCGRSYGSLDKALLACIAWRHDFKRGGFNRAANSRAATYMARMVGLEDA